MLTHISQWAVRPAVSVLLLYQYPAVSVPLLYQYPCCIRTLAVSEPLYIRHFPCPNHIFKSCISTSDLHVMVNQTKIFFRTKFHLNWRHFVYSVDHKAQSAPGLSNLIISWTLVSHKMAKNTQVFCGSLLVSESTCTKQNSGVYIRCYHF